MKQTRKARIFDEIEMMHNDNYVTYKQLETIINRINGYEGRRGLGMWAIALYDSYRPILLTPTKKDSRYLVKIKRGLYQLQFFSA